MTRRRFARLVFEGGWGERDAYETPLRGYRSHVWVELEDGSRHRVTFYDVARLSQTLDDEAASGRPFLGETGLIVLKQVTLASMQASAEVLAGEGFFDPVE